MATRAYTLPHFVQELREIAAGTGDAREITRRVRPRVRALAAAPIWLAPTHAVPDERQGLGIHVLRL